MWDDYGVIRPGRMPFDVYENGQIVFTQNPVAFDAPIGTVVGTISIVNATPTYKLSVGKNPYFDISGNNLVTKAALVGGVDFVQIFAIKGFKRIVQVARIVVSGSASPIPTPLPGTFSVALNLSGAEDNSGFPGAVEMGYWVVRGVSVFRIPISWTALQSSAFATLNTGYLTSISGVLDAAASVGAKLIIDIHTFGNGPGGKVGSVAVPISAFVDLWRKFATALRADPNFHVIEAYDPMNEWSGMDPANPSAASTPAGQAIILQASHDVLFALRGDGDNTPLYLEWDHFSGAWDAVANNIAMLFALILTDPARNSKGQIHCYPDHDNSGGHYVAADEQAAPGLAPPGLSTNVNIIAQRLAAVVALAAQMGVPLILGETGISSDSLNIGGADSTFWIQAGDAMFAYCQANNIQVAVWAGGPGFPTTYDVSHPYPYNPSPTNIVTPGLKDFTTAGLQAVQTALIEKYTGYSGPQPTAYRLDAPFGVTPYAPPGTPIPGFKARYGGKITSTKSFIPSATLLDGTDAGGTFLPNPITMGPGFNGLAPFSYTPASALAAIRIALQSTSGLVDPPSVGCSSATDFFTTLGVAPNIYATFRLVNTYVNPAFKLQRASDGAQMDFYFNARGDLPRQAMQDWANSRSISVITWYDQSGRGAHRNYAAGKATLILVDTDGYPSVKFVSSNTFANVSSPSIGQGQMSIVALINPANTSGFIASQDQGIDNFRLQGNSFGIAPNAGAFSGTVAFGTTTNAWNEICATYSNQYATNNLKSYLNGTLVQQVNCAQFVNASNANQFTVDNFQFSPSLPYIGLQRILMTQYVEYQASDATALHGIITTYFSTSLPDTLTAVNPLIAGAGARNVVAGKTSQPFAGVTISDENSGSPTDSVVITLTGSGGGTLTGSGITGAGPYSIAAGSAASVTTVLQALVYTPAGSSGTSETISLAVTSSAGTSSSSSATVVSVIAAAPAETPFAAPGGTFTPINQFGVNISGGEKSYPDPVTGFNYAYPFDDEIDYWAGNGFGVIRMPVNNRRLQPASYGALDPATRTDEHPQVYRPFSAGTQTNLLAIKAVLDHALTKNMYVAIDMHTFGGMWDSFSGITRILGTDPEALNIYRDLMVRIVTKYKNYPNAIWDIMNEPVGMTAAQWKSVVDVVLADIAAITTLQPVWVCGGQNFSGAHDWVSSGNAAAFASGSFTPPAGLDVSLEPHQYLDSDDSGGHSTVVAGKGATVLSSITSWAVTNSRKLVLGEFGWNFNDSQSSGGVPSTEGTALVNSMIASPAVWTGGTFWLGGSRLFYTNAGYVTGAVPAGLPSGPVTDPPQLSILQTLV